MWQKRERDSGLRDTLVYSAGMALAVAAIVLGVRWVNRDVDFCRGVFRDLVHGRQAVQQRLDWEHLQAVGADIGADYAWLKGEQNLSDYRKTFIEYFVKGFTSQGARFEQFTNWRVLRRAGGAVTVAADYAAKGRTLLFTVPAARPRKVAAIQWLESALEPEEGAACCNDLPLPSLAIDEGDG